MLKEYCPQFASLCSGGDADSLMQSANEYMDDWEDIRTGLAEAQGRMQVALNRYRDIQATMV